MLPLPDPAPGAIPGLPALPGPSADATPPRYDRTHLVLTPEQEEKFRERVRRRIDECRKEMGLERRSPGATVFGSGFGSSGYSAALGARTDSWAWKREMNQALYDGVLDWRVNYYGPQSVFKASNYSLNMPKRWVRLMAARLNETQLGTDPFFAAMPQRASADDEAKAVESYTQGQIGKSNLRQAMQEARRVALIRNEAVVKLAWQRRASVFRGPATVMVPPLAVTGTLPDGSPLLGEAPFVMPDGSLVQPGEPIRLGNGDLIYQDDDTVPLSPDAPDAEVLFKDATFAMPPLPLRQYVAFDDVEQVEVDYEGLDASTIYFKDFLFPPRCRSLREADIMVHVYDATLNELRATYGGFETFENYASGYGAAEGGRARPEQGESETASTRETVGVHECYVLADPDETGRDKWIFCPYDYEGDRFLFLDYLKNHMPRPPFVMIPGVERVENRAYGVGVYEMARDKALFVDLMFNRVNFMASKSGSATFIDEDAIVEVKEGGLKFRLGTDELWTIKGGQGYGPERPPVFRVNLAEVPEQALQLMEEMQQAGQLEIGIVGQDDGNASGLPSTKTATGVVNIQQTGNSLPCGTGSEEPNCHQIATYDYV